jgi:putative transposase
MSEKYKMNDKDGIYFLTMTVVYWIDLFTRRELKDVLVDSLIYCQQHKALKIHAWCIMPSHVHLIISSDSGNLPGIIRDFKKHTNKQIIKEIGQINESRKEWLIRAFEKAGQDINRIKNYKVWQDGNQPKQLESNAFMQQKLDYVHFNPVEAGIVEEQEHYLYSSAKDYAGIKGLVEVDVIE